MNLIKSTARSFPSPAARKRKNLLWGNQGFTIVEIIIVAAIMAVLAMLAIPAYDNIKDRVRVARTIEEIRGIERVIIAWGTDRGGALPPDLATLGATLGFTNDPWGHPYEYHLKTEAGYTGRSGLFGGAMTPLNTDYDLFSQGKDGVTNPDITNANAKHNVIRVNDGGWVGEVKLLTDGLL